MIHPEYQRRAYLQAMGIDVWLPRDSDEPEDSAADTVLADNLGWDELKLCVSECTRCGLSTSRTQTVFGVGNKNATWMIIGEAPGAEEDRCGEPFIGRVGHMLDEMLRAVGQDRKSVFIANILKCRPPNNRDPKPNEALKCRDYLDRQIALVRPSIILAVGKFAAQKLLGSDDAFEQMRGQARDINGIPLVVTYHPANLLRSPSQKRKSWSDLCLARGLVAAAVE
jgi:DNA polymerase